MLYRKLYNNNIFRQWVKNQSPPAEFQYIKSRSKKGLYIFKISQPSIIPIQPPTPKPPPGLGRAQNHTPPVSGWSL